MSAAEPGQDPQAAESLKSTLAHDTDMAELVQFFVEEMGDRVDCIARAASENDLGALRTVAHQLKGSATGYGFEPISNAAASLERLIDEADPAAEVARFQAQVDGLIDLCRRASF